MSEIVCGFEPVYDEKSRVLILGSFPSVKSREVSFYYGNARNRFWKTLCACFKEDIPLGIDEKKTFLLGHGIALWDVVESCEIVGSSDSAIKNYRSADLSRILSSSPLELIMLNGSKAYDIYRGENIDTDVPAIKLPSTSPANTKFSATPWIEALSRVFGGG